MSQTARRSLIRTYEQKMEAVFQDASGGRLTLRAALRRQAERLATTIRTGESYAPFELP